MMGGLLMVCRALTAIALSAPIAGAQLPASASPANWAALSHQRFDRIEVGTSKGFPARIVASRPDRDDSRRYPAVVFIPWLSCDPVELNEATDDGYIRFTRDLAARFDGVVLRVEKPGVDGSAGPSCSVATLDDDFAAFRAGIDAAFRRADVDTTRVFLVGGSIGGAFAVVLGAASTHPIAAVVSINSFSRTWYEHMIDHERRRLELIGRAGSALDDAMRGFESFYDAFLNAKLTPGEVLDRRPELRAYWYDSTAGQYGRSAAYFQQVEALDLGRALATLDVPALFIGGQFDWVMGASEPEYARTTMDRAHPGLARAWIYEGLSHGLHKFHTMTDAFAGKNGVYEPTVAADVVSWLAGVPRRR